jgi:hypothetical protein
MFPDSSVTYVPGLHPRGVAGSCSRKMTFVVAVSAQLILSLVIAPSAPAQRPDSTAIKAAMREEQSFFDKWRKRWMASVEEVFPDFARGGGLVAKPIVDTVPYGGNRAAEQWRDLYCAVDGSLPGYPPSPRTIQSAGALHGICPDWQRYQVLRGHFPVELRLAASLRGDLVTLKDRVERLLDAAAGKMPSDAWVVGQRIRFAVIDGDLARAKGIAGACKSSSWWCNSLQGYVRALQGDTVGADASYTAAIAASTGDLRCNWLDIRSLLEGEGRDQYKQLSCAGQDSVSRLVWWLADPLYAVPGNSRRVEHFTRKVSLILRSGLARDEVHNWPTKFAGDAMAELVMRYGWPDYTWWGGVDHDQSASDWFRSRGSPAAGP